MTRTRSTFPRVLVLTIARDVAPYLPRYFAALEGLDYPREQLSYGFLEGDSADDTPARLIDFVEAAQARGQRAELVRHDAHLHFDGPRWEPSYQRVRRGVLADLRNRLLEATLRDERWVLWIDADVVEFPSETLMRLLAVEREIVAPHCVRAWGGASFDLNTFQRTSRWPRTERRYLVDGLIQPPQGVGRRYLDDLRGRPLVHVDGIGGTMLLLYADLHRRGLRFPRQSYKGYIETEGLAMMARDMGVTSWAIPDLEILHAER